MSAAAWVLRAMAPDWCHSGASGWSRYSSRWRRRLGEDVSDLGWGRVEELAAWVHPVDLAIGEGLVQVRLEGDGVFVEDHGVDVEPERHAGIAELDDPGEGSSRRVIPILTMSGPKAPRLEIT